MTNQTKRVRRALLALLLAVLLSAQALALPAYLIPGGSTVGIQLYARGLVITQVEQDTAAQRAGLRCGDTILQCNGHAVHSAQSLMQLVQGGEAVVLQVQRGEKTAEFLVRPQRVDARYQLGVQLRDRVSGIGTVTFYDPQTGRFGALGHGVSSTADGKLMQISSGVLVPACVAQVQRGTRGTPGMLHGTFDLTQTVGTVTENTARGIFGTVNTLPARAALPVGAAQSVHPGAATVLCSVEGECVTEYAVTIEKVFPSAQSGRDLLLRIDDARLLARTGGVVQGMSGSPIVQDGKLVGAVTHVLVNDPTKGYGIFIENMLDTAE